MLLADFVAFAHRSARGKRLLWRFWYQFLALRYPDQRWTFMNYGYRRPNAAGGQPALQLDPTDEENRSCIQLYDLVARGAPIAAWSYFILPYLEENVVFERLFRAVTPITRKVVAADLSPRAVALCRRRFTHPRLSFEVADAERLPFESASFDVVLNVESSHCYGRFEAFLGEARRVLRADGHFLYADFRPSREIDGWRASLLGAGFAIRAEHDLRPGVLAALDADDLGKRDLIVRLIDRPLVGIFGEFAALHGSELNAALRRGELGYRAFVLTPT